MKNRYEKPMWTADAKRYDNTSAFFAMVALIIGALGILTAIIWFFVGLSGLTSGQLTDVVGSIALGFHSCVLIVFGSMMRMQSKVLLSVFEMSIGETRQNIAQGEAQKDEPAE
ncbi:MAG: hypothetical protein AB8C95_11870 [Phycisphaeraceae bacterium]